MGGEGMTAPVVAVEMGRAVARARGKPLPAAVRETAERLLVDIGGLCVAARREDYVRGQTVLEAKIDALFSELKLVQIQGGKSS